MARRWRETATRPRGCGPSSAWGAAAIAVGWLYGCAGYTPVHGHGVRPKLGVQLVACRIADAAACDEVIAGVENRLLAEGALAPSGTSFPLLEVEVLRADEVAESVAAPPGTDPTAPPSARGLSVGVVARAWVLKTPSAEPRSDTGDVRAFSLVTSEGDVRTSDGRIRDARRAAGYRVGQRLALSVLGVPVAVDEAARDGP